MNDIIDIETILKRKKYSIVYSSSFILIIIILIILYILMTYKYQTYYISKGRMINNNLELLVNIEDLKYIKNNTSLTIDEIKYNYNIEKINNELYVDESYNNYKYVYLEVNNLNNIENYVYEVKIKKENKALVKYLKELF